MNLLVTNQPGCTHFSLVDLCIELITLSFQVKLSTRNRHLSFDCSYYQLVHVLWRLRWHSPLLIDVLKYKSMVGQDLLPLILVNQIIEVYALISFVPSWRWLMQLLIGGAHGTWRGNMSWFVTFVSVMIRIKNPVNRNLVVSLYQKLLEQLFLVLTPLWRSLRGLGLEGYQ